MKRNELIEFRLEDTAPWEPGVFIIRDEAGIWVERPNHSEVRLRETQIRPLA